MNVFQYSAIEQAKFNNVMAECGYEAFTTFFGDLSIAEFVEGASGVKDTYNNVIKSWGSDIKYITEFVMALNHKCWEHHAAGKAELSKVYADLYYKADDFVVDKFKDDEEALSYYYRVTD